MSARRAFIIKMIKFCMYIVQQAQKLYEWTRRQFSNIMYIYCCTKANSLSEAWKISKLAVFHVYWTIEKQNLIPTVVILLYYSFMGLISDNNFLYCYSHVFCDVSHFTYLIFYKNSHKYASWKIENFFIFRIVRCEFQ